MINQKNFLKKWIILLVLLGFIFPMKAPVSSAGAKLCCKSKGHCFMGKETEAKISAMGMTKSANMIACCQDNCLSCSEPSTLHSRTQNFSQYLGMFSAPAPVINIGENSFFYSIGPPYSGLLNSRIISGIHSPPIFQLHSIFLI